MPPWRSASVTTPSGSEIQPRISGSGGPRRGRLRAAEPHQFGGAAADVEQDRRPRPADRSAACSRWRRAAPRSRGRSISSSRPTSSRDAGAGNRRRSAAARQASVAISRARVTPRLRILSRQIAQRLDRALDRRLAQAAGGGDALAQPDDAGERVDDAEAVAGRARHQQPAIVGAEIERGIGRAAAIAAASRASGRPGDRRPHRGRPGGARSSAGSRPGLPGLVVHMSKPSCRAEAASRRSTVAAMFPTIGKSVTAPVRRRNPDVRAESCSCGSGLACFIWQRSDPNDPPKPRHG